jgi:hypothetical protein
MPGAFSSDPSGLNTVLATLRQTFADVGLVLGIMADLRARADRMQPLLADELREHRPPIDQAIVLLTEQES